jgi:phosphatidylglycerophosphate synthase
LPTVEVSFSALPAHVRTARLIAVAVARRAGVAEDLLDEVRLAVGEACSRAVELHQRHKAGASIAMSLVDEQDRFTIEVIDQAPADGESSAADLDQIDAASLAQPEHLDLTAAPTAEPGSDLPPAGFGLPVVRGLVDHVDGYKARNHNQRSTFGAVMDDVCDRWVLGIMYAGGCLNLANDYPHVLIVLGFGITGSLTNVIIKLSIYAESQPDIWREKGKIGHPVDVVGLFGSAEFLIYYGFGVFFTALLHDPRPLLAGCWAVAIMSHVSLLQRVRFAWKRYRFVDPGLVTDDDKAEAG